MFQPDARKVESFDPTHLISDAYGFGVEHNVVDEFKLKGSHEYEYVCQIDGWWGSGVGACTVGQLSRTAVGLAVGVAVDSSGNVYVSDGANHVVDIFGPSGPPQPKVPLTVEVTGGGIGSVTSSPAGINCGATCSHEFEEGMRVTLDSDG